MSLAGLRHQDHYLAVSRELRAAGYSWREEMGGKHAKLLVQTPAGERVVTISVSPSDHRTAVNAAGQIRRSIRLWQSEVAQLQAAATPDLFPTLEKETMDLSVTDFALHEFDDEPRLIDVDLGERLGYGRPERIRDVIKRNKAEFLDLGDLPQIAVNPGSAGRPADGWYLNEEQALLAASLAKTDRGASVRKMLIKSFVAWRRGHTPVTIAVGDDTQALLEMLADLRSAIVSAQQNGHTTSLEHIDGAKAAVLHYLKAYLKEPATAFYEDVRTRNVATYERDRRLIEGIESLTRTVGAMLDRTAPVLRDRPFIWTEWYDCDRLYSEWFPERHIPRRGLLSGVVSRALDRHCKTTRKFHHMEHRIVGGKGVNWWHKDSVFAWLEAGGRDLIATHLDRYSQEPRRPILALVN